MPHLVYLVANCIVGALQYSTLTHPRIAFSVNQLYQRLHALTTTHWISAKRVLHCTIDHDLYYMCGSLNLHAYCED